MLVCGATCFLGGRRKSTSQNVEAFAFLARCKKLQGLHKIIGLAGAGLVCFGRSFLKTSKSAFWEIMVVFGSFILASCEIAQTRAALVAGRQVCGSYVIFCVSPGRGANFHVPRVTHRRLCACRTALDYVRCFAEIFSRDHKLTGSAELLPRDIYICGRFPLLLWPAYRHLFMNTLYFLDPSPWRGTSRCVSTWTDVLLWQSIVFRMFGIGRPRTCSQEFASFSPLKCRQV